MKGLCHKKIVNSLPQMAVAVSSPAKSGLCAITISQGCVYKNLSFGAGPLESHWCMPDR